MRKYMGCLLIISTLILTSCGSKLDDSKLKIDELNKTISKLEDDLENKTNEIETYDKEDKIKTTKIVQLENRIKANQNNPKETYRSEKYLKSIIKIYHNLPKIYLDLKEYPDYKNIEVSDESNREYQEILGKYYRYIPDFKNIDELSSKELIDIAILLYRSYDFSFVSRDYSKNYAPKEDLELIVEKVFGSNIKNHESVGLANYKDNKYYYGGFSYHGHYISDIISFYEIDKNTYHIVADFYFIDELSEKSYEEYTEMFKNGEGYITASCKMILKKETTEDGEVFRVISKETIGNTNGEDGTFFVN